MNQKQAKRARSLAHTEAIKQNVWKKGEEQVFDDWKKRFLAKIFPSFKNKKLSIVGRWYKSVLKKWSKQAYSSIHDKEIQELERARRKVAG